MSRDPSKLKVFNLGILKKADQEPLVRRYDDLIRSVQKLLTVLRHPKPVAYGPKPWLLRISGGDTVS